MKSLHKYFDIDKDGGVSYNEFLNALSPAKLSKRKQAIVEKIWALLDKAGTGYCTGQDISDNMKNHEALDRFLDTFEGTHADKLAGKISKHEFFY